MWRWLIRLWSLLRQVSGDDAYERYLAHWHATHASAEQAPLNRAAFFRQAQGHKWNRLRRCC